jgi:hypothetical protein
MKRRPTARRAAAGFADGLAIIGAGIALLLVLEVEKRIRFRSEAS